MEKRGAKELACLGIVKEHTLGFNPSNEEFKKLCFGLTLSDRIELLNLLNDARPNACPNSFPDFITQNGFIEHFQITSGPLKGKDGIKGAVLQEGESIYRRSVQTERAKIESEGKKGEIFEWNGPIFNHSHENLTTSFKHNWEKHIQSLRKYDGKAAVSAFLIEYGDMGLSMHETQYERGKETLSQGDFEDEHNYKIYRLSRDKTLLKYMLGFQDEIKYVIFVSLRNCEIFKLENIPFILQLIPYDYDYHPCVSGLLDSTI